MVLQKSAGSFTFGWGLFRTSMSLNIKRTKEFSGVGPGTKGQFERSLILLRTRLEERPRSRT